jgi:nucleoside-diphosphate-sugar epimerase
MSKRTIESCRVCVVGGAGFLGSHMVDHLIQERNCRVLVLDNLSSGFKKFIHPKANFVHADITDSETYLHKAFCHHQIEYVFNYAASPYIPDSFERPLHVFNINAFGALKVINAAQEAGCKGILQISSAEIYGGMGHFLSSEDAEKTLDKSIPRPLSEEEFVIPHSSYGASKAAIDSMVTARWKENRTPAIALRQFNCVGPRETHPYIVPEIISQISKFEYKEDMHGVYPVPIHLGNNSRRDFIGK